MDFVPNTALSHIHTNSLSLAVGTVNIDARLMTARERAVRSPRAAPRTLRYEQCFPIQSLSHTPSLSPSLPPSLSLSLSLSLSFSLRQTVHNLDDLSVQTRGRDRRARARSLDNQRLRHVPAV